MSRGCCSISYSILGCPLGSHFPVGRIEINNKTGRYALCFFLPLFWAFFPAVVGLFLAVVDLLACSPSLSSSSRLLGLDHLLMLSGFEGWCWFCLRGHLMGIVSNENKK